MDKDNLVFFVKLGTNIRYLTPENTPVIIECDHLKNIRVPIGFIPMLISEFDIKFSLEKR